MLFAMDACGRVIREGLAPLARDPPPSRVLATVTLRVLEAGVPVLVSILILILILSMYEGRSQAGRLWSPSPLAPLAPVFTGVSPKKKKKIKHSHPLRGCYDIVRIFGGRGEGREETRGVME